MNRFTLPLVKRMFFPLLKKILFIALIVIFILFVLSQCGCRKQRNEPPVTGVSLPLVVPPIELPFSKPTVCEPPFSFEEGWLPEGLTSLTDQ